ncbi:MAG: ATP-binding protein [Candidatus Thermoplasmatota archaeon]|jgi:hypothetical protein|nr:ATP-binding protein [Candidatus Thermoplasmatota archaeon]MCL5984043.1 ATP-binding protein [Candidatus Thermoplasmatota archaeon]
MNTGVVTGGAHVPRAVLATAAEFSDVPRSAAEYIWNAMEYKRDKTLPAEVVIRLGRDKDGGWFEVEDFANGAGMDVDGIQRFFTMHAPNENRLRGNAGRGRNGTGKAAAFGVGSLLNLYTVRDGIENQVSLSKEDLVALESTYPCEALPLRHHVQNHTTQDGAPRCGTRVRVSGIQINFDERVVVEGLTRLFMRVLDHNILYWEKSSGKRVRVLRRAPAVYTNQDYDSPTKLEPYIGKVVLHLMAADSDLPRQEGGVTVTTVGGSVIEAGYIDVVKRRTVVDRRIFGEVEVPLLDEPDSVGRTATTQARRLEMNRESERVQQLLEWVDECINDFREQVQEKLSSSIEERDQAVLSAMSNSLERVLNEQYEKFMKGYSARMKLARSDPLAPLPGEGASTSGGPSIDGTGERIFVKGVEGDVKVTPDPAGDIVISGPGINNGTGGDAPGTSVATLGRVDNEGEPAMEKRRGTKKSRGGSSLQVKHLGLGESSPRSYYDGEGTFTINKDHPDFRGLQTSDSEFMRRSAEACAISYAQAIVELRVKDGDPTVTKPTDALNSFLDEHDKVLRPLLAVCPEADYDLLRS